MKKLFSLLGTISLTATIASSVVACNKPSNKGKRNNETFVLKNVESIKNINIKIDKIINDKKNNIYFVSEDSDFYVLKPNETAATKIKGIIGTFRKFSVDNNNNVYYGVSGTSDCVYILKYGETAATKIKGVYNDLISNIAVDSKNNIYFSTNSYSYILKYGETTATKINGIDVNISNIEIDSKDNIYFISGYYSKIFVLKQGETTATKINGINDFMGDVKKILIDSKNKVYFGTNQGVYILKQGETTATKINGINEYERKKTSIIIDSKDNVYFIDNKNIYFLKSSETIVTKIQRLDWNFDSINLGVVDKNNDLYFISTKNYLCYLYKLNFAALDTTVTKIIQIIGVKIYPELIRNIDVIYNKNNLYFVTIRSAYKRKIYVLKHGETSLTKIINENEVQINFIILYGNIAYFGTNKGIYVLKPNETTATLMENTKKLGPAINTYVDTTNKVIYVISDKGIYKIF